MLTWTPTTCTCHMEFGSENGVKVNAPANLRRVLRRCPDHQELTDAEVCDAVLRENRTTNVTMEAIRTIAPALKDADLLPFVELVGTGIGRTVRVSARLGLRPNEKAALLSEAARSRGALPHSTAEVTVE